MTIRHLKVFIKVAELNSISKAAEYFYVAQPSVSETIKQLESYYNVTLFNRNNRTLSLTKDGEELLLKAKHVVESFDEFENIANDKYKKRVIRIGSTLTFTEHLLHKLLDHINNIYKDIDIKIKIDTPKELEEDLHIGNLDIIFTEKLPIYNDLNLIEVGSDRLVLVASNTFNAPSSIKLIDLVNYDLLVREKYSPARYLLDVELEKLGIKAFNYKVESIYSLALIRMCKDGMGLALLPYYSVEEYLNSGVLREISLDKELNRKVYIVSNQSIKNKDILLELENYLSNFVK